MAVAGRRVSDYYDSLSKSSAEDFHHICEPCLVNGQTIKVNGFCAVCQQYLCKPCVAYHQRTKVTKHHQLFDKDSIEKRTIQTKDSAVRAAKKCHIHNNEIIKFFCTNHEFLGCNDCITLNHINCKIDYIPDKCADFGDSAEYKEILRELDQKMKDVYAVIKKAMLKDKHIDSSYDYVLKEIIKFREEIDAHLDQLQKQVQSDADKKKSADKQTVKTVLETCFSISSDIMKYKDSLQDKKTSQQHGQLYIMVKQAKSNLDSDDVKHAHKSLEESSIQYKFQRNKTLENLITKQDKFGKLLKKKLAFNKLTHREDINVKTKSDKEECWITGCAALSTYMLVLADRNNDKLKVVDTQSKVVIEEKSLDSWPWGIAVLPQDQITVTMPDKQTILILSTAGKLSFSRTILVKRKCRDVTYHQGQLYMVCWDPCCVIIADTQGNVNSRTSLNNEISASPYYILLSEIPDVNIYLSNYSNHSVVRVTLQGDILAVYKHKDISGPTGMARLADGSLLVHSHLYHTIHHISADLKQGQTIVRGLQRPWCICYNHHEQEVYIGGNCDQLKVIKITWKQI